MQTPHAFGLAVLVAADTTHGFTLPVYQDPAQKRVISARDLHRALNIGKDFSTWIKDRIGKFRFKHGVDYEMIRPPKEVFPKSGENLGGRPKAEYILSLDAAKLVAMGTNNKVGNQVKQYFLWCERQVLAATLPRKPEPTTPFMPGLEEHMAPAFQRQQSRVLQKFLKEHGGGVNAVIQHGRTTCLEQTGLGARQVVAIGKQVGLPAPQRRNAREVMRHLAPAVACAMSLADTMVLLGAGKQAANELAAASQELFDGMIQLGLAPAESVRGPRFLA